MSSLFRRGGSKLLRTLQRALDPAAAVAEVQRYAKLVGGVTVPFGRYSNGEIFQEVFGSSYLSAANAARLTTTGTIFITHTSIITPATTGRFVVYGIAQVDTALTMEARLQNVTDGAQIGATAQITSMSSMDRLPAVFAGEVTFGGATKTIALQFRDNPPGGQTAGMRAGFISMWRINF